MHNIIKNSSSCVKPPDLCVCVCVCEMFVWSCISARSLVSCLVFLPPLCLSVKQECVGVCFTRMSRYATWSVCVCGFYRAQYRLSLSWDICASMDTPPHPKQPQISHHMMISTHFAGVNHWKYVRKLVFDTLWTCVSVWMWYFLPRCVILWALYVCWSLQERETRSDHDWWGSLWRTGTVWITHYWGKSKHTPSPSDMKHKTMKPNSWRVTASALSYRKQANVNVWLRDSTHPHTQISQDKLSLYWAL